MRISRRIVALLASASLVFALAACGNTGATTKKADETTAAKETTAAAEDTTAAEKETTAKADETTEKADETTEKAEETTAAAEETTEKAEETTAAPTGDVELAGKIVVYTRDATSGTRAAFEEIVGFEGELTDTALETSGNGDMAAKVGADAHGIGYVSLTTDFEANNLRKVNYNGVEPTEENVLDGSYTLARPFNYVMRADFVDEDTEALTRAFVAFITESVEGMEAIFGAGGIVDPDLGRPWDEVKEDHPIVDQDNSGLTLRTGGSTSVEKVLTAALEAFVPLAGNFEFAMNHTGSGDGYKRTLGGEKDGANAIELGFASRAFKTDGTEDFGADDVYGTFCKDAVVVVVSEDNAGVTELTQEQIAAIFKGEVTDWSEVDEIVPEKMTGKIVVYTRDATSGTRGAFEEIVGFEGELTDTALETSGNGDMAAKVGADSHGIGYVSLTTDFEANKLRKVNYDGVEPTEENALDGSYTLARPFNYVMRADFVDEDTEALTRAFVAFITESMEGMEAIFGAGGIVDPDQGEPWDEIKKDHPIVDQDNSGLTLRTGGSTSVEKVLTAALEAFVPLAGNFEFAMNHTGSGDGYKRTLGGEKDGANAIELGFASRAFKTDGTEDFGADDVYGTFCKDAVVVVVSEENTSVTELSQAQVAAIFKGEVTDWGDIDEIEADKMAGKIVVYTRDATSGTRGAFEEIVGFEGELTDTALETSGNGDMAAKVGADSHGIGYVSLTTDFKANKLRKVNYDGVEPTEENVLDGSYTLARPFNYVMRADFVDEDTEALTRAFVAFITESMEGMEAIFGAGGIVDPDQGEPWDEIKKDHPIVDQDNSGLTLRTGGSTSVEKVLTAALEAFVPLAGNFEFAMNHTGSGDGYKRTLGGEKNGANAIELGFASRAFKNDGTEDFGADDVYGTFCKDAVVVVVSEENTGVTNLTQDQVAAIFKGEVTDWSEIN